MTPFLLVDFKLMTDIFLPINKLKHLLKNRKQYPCTLNLPSLIFAAFGQIQNFLHLLDKLIQEIPIHCTKDDKECSADRTPNYPAHGTELIETRRHSGCGGCNDNRRDYDNTDRRLNRH